MSTTPMIEASPQPTTNAVAASGSVLVCLPFATSEELKAVEAAAAEGLPGFATAFAVPGLSPEERSATLLELPRTAQHDGTWLLSAADYLAASQLAVERQASVTLLLGAEAGSLSPEAMQHLVSAVMAGTDVAMPRYPVGPHEGLISSALLYPMTNALFGVTAHMPLGPDVAFSLKMAQRFSALSRKAAGSQTETLLWPASEAAIASCSAREVAVGRRSLPQPVNLDLNAIIAQIVGSLFNDMEAKATFWQRARPTVTAKPLPEPAAAAAPELDEVRGMVDGFRNAYDNLQEIWSLVLPPQSLLRVKRLSRASAEEFAFPADLWARTAYDFLLAYHLRTINRGHLLGALTPIYLAWVASHVRLSGDDEARALYHVEETAAAFVAEKPYIVSRWRWPDRFNP